MAKSAPRKLIAVVIPRSSLRKAQDITKTRQIQHKTRPKAVRRGGVSRKAGKMAPKKDDHRSPLQKKVESIMNAVYYEIVSPHMNEVKKVKTLSDWRTYGEMKPAFVSSMLAEFGINKDSKFVDLGSGVGNIVLQAHLETGCRSNGFELDKNRHEIGMKFGRGVETRVYEDGNRQDSPLKGITSYGGFRKKVRLNHMDCATNWLIWDAARGADLVFSANLKFPSEVNDILRDEILTLMKDGTVFVTLTRLVQGKSGERRRFLEENSLLEEQRMSGEEAVSWTDQPVEYWVYRKAVRRDEIDEAQHS